MDEQSHHERDQLLYPDEVCQIQGAVFEVSRQMGAGFLEAVYHEWLALEFAAQGIPFVAGQPLKLSYKGAPLRQTYVPDFVCYERVIVELKAVRDLAPEHEPLACRSDCRSISAARRRRASSAS